LERGGRAETRGISDLAVVRCSSRGYTTNNAWADARGAGGQWSAATSCGGDAGVATTTRRARAYDLPSLSVDGSNGENDERELFREEHYELEVEERGMRGWVCVTRWVDERMGTCLGFTRQLGCVILTVFV